VAIVSYAGPWWFAGGAIAAGAFAAALPWLPGNSQRRSLRSLLLLWLILSAIIAAQVILFSSMLLQREAGIFDSGSAAGAAGIMGPLTSLLLPLIAAKQGILDRTMLIFGLVAGSVMGFAIWLFAFALVPRLHEFLSG
jgi:hypothetical protein